MTPASKRPTTPVTRFAVFGSVARLENVRRTRAKTRKHRSRCLRSLRSTTRRHRTTRQSSLPRKPGPSRVVDFRTERAALAQARNAGLLRNTPDTIPVEFSAGILLREKSADKKNPVRQHQKNKSGTTGKDADSSNHRQECEIKRIARVTKRPVGYERFRMLCGVVHDFGS